ncbi:MAG: peptidoglycan recognition family protein [Elusimicrobia bacterium]|nr:peptidoglycan recognition family protein [Elusimicrobiota bacterium]
MGMIAGLFALLVLPASANDVGESVRFKGRAVMRAEPFQPSGTGSVLFDTGASDQPAAPYDAVLLQGIMPDGGLRIEVALPSFGGLWTSWAPAEVKRFPSGRFWARYRFDGPGRLPLRLRVVDAGVKAAHLFEIFDAELFVAGTGVEAGARTGEVPPAVQPSSGTYRFVRRADWGAQPPTSDYTAHTPGRLTMHHTAGRKPATFAEAAAEMRFIQDFHINGRGWIDVGYHFVISPTGHVFEGRPEGVVGAHVLNHNTGNVGASFMGNYQPPATGEPAAEALSAFVALGRRLVSDHRIPAEKVQAHRDLGSSDCPGDTLYAKLPGLREQIAAGPRLPKGDLPVEAYLKSLPW